VKARDEQIEKIKAEILQALKDSGFSEAKIILFGSRARGEDRQDSDWDFLIILEPELSITEKRRIAHRIRKRLAEFYLASDVIVRSEAEVEERKNVIGSVIKSALEEGFQI